MVTCCHSRAFQPFPVATKNLQGTSGERSMADKTSFTKEEWTLVLKSPMIAGMAITAADPSGLWGLLNESFAAAAALTKVATDTNANALVKAMVAAFQTSEGRSAAREGVYAE